MFYQRFTARYGFINAKQNLKDLDQRSPLVPFLRALEEPTGKSFWKKSALFTQRTIRPYHRTAHVGSAKEALLVCLNECGRVDLARIAALAGKSPAEVVQELEGLIYELPSGAYQLEMKPEGSGFRMNTRFNKFTNLPELAALWRQVLDVKNADQLNLPRPQLIGGAPQVISIPASPALKKFVKPLAARVERIKSKRVPPAVDNMLKVTSEGRKAALDIRLVLPGEPRPQSSKVAALTDTLVEFYHASNSQRGVQLVFCDLATPKAKAA